MYYYRLPVRNDALIDKREILVSNWLILSLRFYFSNQMLLILILITRRRPGKNQIKRESPRFITSRDCFTLIFECSLEAELPFRCQKPSILRKKIRDFRMFGRGTCSDAWMEHRNTYFILMLLFSTDSPLRGPPSEQNTETLLCVKDNAIFR